MNIVGSIYNTKYNLILSRNINKKNATNFQIKFKKLNVIIKNNFFENLNKKNNYHGITNINFSGSEINASYKIIDKLITLQSEKSVLNNQNISFTGNISTSPFYFDVNINFEQINVAKLIENLFKTMNLFDTEKDKNTFILRGDILPKPRAEFISLIKYSLPDVLLTGDQSVTDGISYSNMNKRI